MGQEERYLKFRRSVSIISFECHPQDVSQVAPQEAAEASMVCRFHP